MRTLARELTANGHRVSFSSNKNVLSLTAMVGALTVSPLNITGHFKRVNSMVCELYLNKAVRKRKYIT